MHAVHVVCYKPVSICLTILECRIENCDLLYAYMPIQSPTQAIYLQFPMAYLISSYIVIPTPIVLALPIYLYSHLYTYLYIQCPLPTTAITIIQSPILSNKSNYVCILHFDYFIFSLCIILCCMVQLNLTLCFYTDFIQKTDQWFSFLVHSCAIIDNSRSLSNFLHGCGWLQQMLSCMVSANGAIYGAITCVRS